MSSETANKNEMRASKLRRAEVAKRFTDIRNFSDQIASVLEPEDCVIQSMPDVSPMRWHLAHTSWFFETFVLKPFGQFAPVDANFEYLFNSYYNAIGEQFPRDKRGCLSRPVVAEIFRYRAAINERILEILDNLSENKGHLWSTLETGLNHEQQHQELMLADIKHVFSCNPIFPVYTPGGILKITAPKQTWVEIHEGLHWLGHAGEGFSFDNESPRHRQFVDAFQLSNRLVTNGEFLEFTQDGGYARSELWLSLGWSECQRQQWKHPLYWMQREGQWFEFTLGGLVKLDLEQPLTHVSYFEADAFARWNGSRLPTEAEWEIAASGERLSGMSSEDFFELAAPVHPNHAGCSERFHALFGSVWQWTSSAYAAYPGYAPPAGALGEYNGKFMCNQYVLRGSSCATPRGHGRLTYRNFFPPEARWQFSGIRLARATAKIDA